MYTVSPCCGPASGQKPLGRRGACRADQDKYQPTRDSDHSPGLPAGTANAGGGDG